MKTRKNVQSMSQKIFSKEGGEEGAKRYYVLIKDFNIFLYDHTLHY